MNHDIMTVLKFPASATFYHASTCSEMAESIESMKLKPRKSACVALIKNIGSCSGTIRNEIAELWHACNILSPADVVLHRRKLDMNKQYRRCYLDFRATWWSLEKKIIHNVSRSSTPGARCSTCSHSINICPTLYDHLTRVWAQMLGSMTRSLFWYQERSWSTGTALNVRGWAEVVHSGVLLACWKRLCHIEPRSAWCKPNPPTTGPLLSIFICFFLSCATSSSFLEMYLHPHNLKCSQQEVTMI